MLPKITELQFETQQTETVPQIGKSFLYDFEIGDFVLINGKMVPVEQLEALKMWIIKALKTERYKFRIYDSKEYGTTIEDLIGTNFPQSFVEAELKREITTSLLRHPLIESIYNWSFEKVKERLKIYFTVITPENAFDMEVNL